MIPRWLRHASRADFLNSVGLYLSRESLSLVCMRKNLFRISVTHHEVLQIPALGDEAEARQALAEAMGPLLANFTPSEDPLYVCLSPDQTLVCEVLLPQVAEESVQQVLQYEMARLLPFRREELYYDFLFKGKRGDRISLLLFAAPRRALDWIFDTLSSFGIRPAGVEPAVTALCNYFLYCAESVTAPSVVLCGSGNALDIVGVSAKSIGWKDEAQILFSHRSPMADWTRGPVRDLFNSLGLQSTRLFSFGPVHDFLSLVQDGSMEVENLVHVGKGRLATPSGTIQEPLVPAVGTALRGLREAELQINLRAQGPAVDGHGPRIFNFNGRLLLVFVVGVLLWVASYPIRDEIRLARLNRQIAELAPSVQAVQRTEDEVNQLAGEISMLAGLSHRRGEILRLLEELSRMVPTSAYLSILRYRDGEVELRGSAENASSLVPLLERSALLKSVGFSAPTHRGRDNRETFSLKAEVEK